MRRLNLTNKTWTIAAVIFFLAIFEASVRANGIYGNGTGAESMSMGGADVGWARSPLQAMGGNPAGLGFLTQNEFDLGGVGGVIEGDFNKPSSGSSDDLDSSPQALPEAALGFPLSSNFTVGISFVPDAMLLADWHYLDPPGGLGGTIFYGPQEDKSEILVLRSAIGIGLKLGEQVSVGLSIGAVYNQNELVTPYVFQNLSAPDGGFDGAKTLLDLRTAGFGWNAHVGALYRPLTNLQFGITYENKYEVATTGTANGNAYAQFGSTPGNPTYGFHYNAEVDNTFPDQVSVGGTWGFLPNWRVAAQVDWIDWASAFHTLPVKLTDGTGPTGTIIPGALGTQFQDNIPLNWKSEFVYRAGLQYTVAKSLSLRAGYVHGNSPVPDSTLTPMTAAITENSVTAGVGYRWRSCQLDLAYEYDLPATQHVATSGLLSGEYSNSSTEVAIHWVAVTLSVGF